jgi:hypothetical protein
MAGNANPFLETSVYTLSTSLVLGDLLPVLSLGGLSVLYVAIGADSKDQIKTLPVCTHCQPCRMSLEKSSASLLFLDRFRMTCSEARHWISVIYPKTKEKHLIFPMTCDMAGNANPFLETSVYTLSIG